MNFSAMGKNQDFASITKKAEEENEEFLIPKPPVLEKFKQRYTRFKRSGSSLLKSSNKKGPHRLER